MTPRPYVEIPRPYEYSPERYDVELTFPASNRKRAEQHHRIAFELARIHPVDTHTPYKLNPRWSLYEEKWGNGERFGSPDRRRLKVDGSPRALAHYLATLQRVLTTVERMATRAARAFGSWQRSLPGQMEGHLEFEDTTTLRIRAKDFRASALAALTGFLAHGAVEVVHRDRSRPLWEQASTVAAEVWAETGGINPWVVPEDEVEEQLQRMRPLNLSVVEAPEQSAPQVPDTVEGLLELSGPAEQAPHTVREAPRPPVRTAHGHDRLVRAARHRRPPVRPNGPAPASRPGAGRRERLVAD
ncbi:hypothetical protein [Streptomyces qinglanensis]|uniref:hypothetical protein n=1 Tax=Streptomyces qinglanensis TaxID=943816 RepID=UPI003D752F58